MSRTLVAFASALVGVVLTVPYAVLLFRDLPPKPQRAVNQPAQQMTPEQIITVSECCVTFYAITYFVGRRIYAALGRQGDLAELQAFSGGHMALLHSMGGTFMIVCPMMNRPAGNPTSKYISIAIGLALLGSGLGRIIGWIRIKLFPNGHEPQAPPANKPGG
jgi:hypothetical protein